MKRLLASVVCATILALPPFAAAVAADRPVLRVIVVQPTDVAAYVKEIDAVRALWKKHKVPATLTVWRATYAGADTGAVVVGVQFPSLVALAQGMEAIRSNAEIGAEMTKVVALRKVVSDSLYEELSD
jgi:hypothetical protein